MSVNKKIIDALAFLKVPIEADLYEGAGESYVVFNYADDRGFGHADGEPSDNKVAMQVHFFMSLKGNPLPFKKNIREALFKAGFTYPAVTIIPETETSKRHLIFECEILERIGEQQNGKN